MPEITIAQLHELSEDAFRLLRLYQHKDLLGQITTPFDEVPCPSLDIQRDTLVEFLGRVYFREN